MPNQTDTTAGDIMKKITYHALREYQGYVEMIRVTREPFNGGRRGFEETAHVAFFTDADEAKAAMRKANGV